MKRRRFLYTPIQLIVIYLVLTLCLFKWGAYSWNVDEPLYFWLLNGLYILSLVLGYIFGIVWKTNRFSSTEKTFRNKNQCFFLLAILSFGCTYLEIIRGLGLNTINLLEVINRLKIALIDPSVLYMYSYSDEFFGNFGGGIVTITILMLQPVVFSIVPLYAFWYSSLKLKNKIVGFLVIIMQLIKWISSGKNKGIFDILIYFGVVILIKLFRRNVSGKKLGIKNKITIILLVFAGCFSIFHFGNMVNARLGGAWETYCIGGYSVNLSSPLLEFLPDKLKGLGTYLTMYLTQGYQALSLIISMQWIPMWGIGYSKFLVEYMDKYFNTNIASFTYQYRLIEYGWDPNLNWHTLYLYIANDTGLLGCSLALIALGALISITYYETLYQNSALSLLMLVQLVIVCLYIPANNIIFNHIGSFYVFYTIFLIWIVSKTTLIKRKIHF